MAVIEAQGLTKVFRVFDRRPGFFGSLRDIVDRRYRELRAVDDVSLVIEPGEIVGYIGPNGAGKSTTIKMLTGIVVPTSGTVRVNGFDPQRERRRYVRTLGAVFGQRTQLWWDLALVESLELLRQLYGVSKADFEQRLKSFHAVLGIDEFMHTPVRKLSLGQRMKADLAASLVHNPPVVFLDEPTVGVDVVTKEHLRSFLRQLREENGTTILLTTHDMQDIEALCDRIVVIDHGKIMHDGALEAFKHRYGGRKRVVIRLQRAIDESGLDALAREGVSWELVSAVECVALVDTAVAPIAEVLQQALDGLPVADIGVEEPTIERVVKQLYGGAEVIGLGASV